MSVDINKLGEETIKEIRQTLVKIYPTVIQYLQSNHPELIQIYNYYYKKAMESEWQIAIEYAYRILRVYVEIKGIQP